MWKGKYWLIFLLPVFVTACRMEHTEVAEKWEDGSPKKVLTYRGAGDDRLLIRETQYFPGKKVYIEGGYKEGKRHGKWTSYFQNGKINSEIDYVNGMEEGMKVVYFENGKVKFKGPVSKGERQGKWQYFDEFGQLHKEVDFSAPRPE